MGVWPGGKSRWVLGVLLGCVALLILAPAALATGGAGQISGTVTKAGSAEVLEGIEVCVYGASGELEGPFVEQCARTGADGTYTVTELPGGEYDVEFFAPSPLNYVTQYYNDKSSFSEAQAVPVGAGVTLGIDAAMQVGGEIKGTVTEASTHKGLSNIEVTVREANNKELPVGYATTEAGGEYTVRGLAEGSYKVEFSPGLESGLNYVTQYYNGASSLADATSVPVTQGAAASGINAELQVGGEITGKVTDATTHMPVSKVLVLAIGPGEVIANVARTDASGQYTIAGLASGVYKIEFVGLGTSLLYITQYYNGKPSLASADPVTANEGSTTPGVNAALVRKAPVNTGAPVASGTPAVGKALSCSIGSWTGSPAPTYSYTWLRNGSPIAGATGAAYVVQAADQRAGLACRVTAMNRNGMAAAVSNTLTVPAAPPPPPLTPLITLLSSRILASGGAARVPIACANATCTGTIELTEQIVVRHRHHGKTRSKRETLVLGRGSYALTVGHSAMILVRLTHTGKNALARARHHRLSATARVSVIGGVPKYIPILLSERPRKHRHRRR